MRDTSLDSSQSRFMPSPSQCVALSGHQKMQTRRPLWIRKLPVSRADAIWRLSSPSACLGTQIRLQASIRPALTSSVINGSLDRVGVKESGPESEPSALCERSDTNANFERRKFRLQQPRSVMESLSRQAWLVHTDDQGTSR